MKKIGIIGGLSPESTVSYYLYLTRKHTQVFGDVSFPEIIIYSVNLENYHRWRNQNRWDLIAEDLLKAAEKLRLAGAEIGLIATNTMHKVFDEVANRTPLPLVNLLEAVAKDITDKGINCVGLIGTSFSMNDGFYQDYLQQHNITTLTPTPQEQAYIHSVIENELVKGQFLADSKHKFIDIISRLQAKGAKGIILGCTEIPLLIEQTDCGLPVFDTATIHADYLFQQII